MGNRSSSQIPIIDLFAGPGGLGEGFSAFTDERGNKPFKIAISVEKETNAHRTLLVRSFYRQFSQAEVPDVFYRHLRGETNYEAFLAEIATTPQGIAALDEARQHELGADASRDAELSRNISTKIAGRECVLIGGPPCQAYSLVGRSRNMGTKGYRLETDPKAKLYLEYLQLIADQVPAVFVMENVKGLLSSRMDGMRVFDKIRDDLRNPAEALRREGRRYIGRKATYRLQALSHEGLFEDLSPRDFVVRCEEHGIPQARHRVILVGIREDLPGARLGRLPFAPGPPVQTMLRDLPRLRSALSKEADNAELWTDAVLELCAPRWQKRIRDFGGDLVADRITKLKSRRRRMLRLKRGGEFIARESNCRYEPGWFNDPRLAGVCNHSTRSHIRNDLLRYAFAAAYADATPKHLSPSLADFPSEFLPKHKNVDEAIAGVMFGDRFRVQVRSRPSTTVTSHISKDGHYYIHYDPTQCRSLTVREAARLQTFPDNYFFEGPRTSQYVQVGNAVPPLLALQIAELVAELMS